MAVAEAVAIAVEAAAIVAEAVAIVAEAVVIAAEAAVTTGEGDQAILHHAAAEVVPRALTEGRCPSVVVQRATAVAVVGCREVGRPTSNLAYTCKSDSQMSLADIH